MNNHKNIDTVCPYCGSGCVITCTVDTETNRVIEAKALRKASTTKAAFA